MFIINEPSKAASDSMILAFRWGTLWKINPWEVLTPKQHRACSSVWTMLESRRKITSARTSGSLTPIRSIPNLPWNLSFWISNLNTWMYLSAYPLQQWHCSSYAMPVSRFKPALANGFLFLAMSQLDPPATFSVCLASVAHNHGHGSCTHASPQEARMITWLSGDHHLVIFVAHQPCIVYWIAPGASILH